MTTARIVNTTRGCLLALNALVPETPQERSRGLLDHDSLPYDSGLLLLDCSAIHTLGMQFAIDVIFCDGRGRVKFAGTCRPEKRRIELNGSRFVIELPAGRLALTETQLGDQITLDFTGPR